MVRMYPPQSFRGYVGTNTNFPGQGGEGGGIIQQAFIEGLGDGDVVEFNGIIPNRIEHFEDTTLDRLVTEGGAHEGFQWSKETEDGNFYYIYDGINEIVRQYDCPTSYDFVGAVLSPFNFPHPSGFELDFDWSSTGLSFFILDFESPDFILRENLFDSLWTFQTPSAAAPSMFNFGSFVVNSFAFSKDGLRFFALNIFNATVSQYNLTVPFNLTTMTFSGKSFSYPTNFLTSPKNVRISDNGLHLFISDSGGKIVRFDIETANEIDTTNPTQFILDVTIHGTSFFGFDLDSDELKLVFGNDALATPQLFEYEATTVQELVEVIQS